MPRHSGRSMRVEPHSFAAVIRAYLQSPHFAKLAPSTQQTYRIYLRIAELPDVLGGLPVTVIRPSLVQKFLNGLADKPGAQIRARVAIKAVEAFALPLDLLPHSITTGTTVIGSHGGHKPWTDEQVSIAEQYAAPHIAKLITLAANTGQRGSDLCRMRWSDIEDVDGRQGINVVQRKTGLQLWIPFTLELQYAVSMWERRPTFILLNRQGQPYGNRKNLSMSWERERDGNAALAPCAGLVLHGLRATAVVRLRRAGATTPQIVDMVGLSAPMVERYSRFADQKQSALAAVLHLDRNRNKTEQEPQKVTEKGSVKP